MGALLPEERPRPQLRQEGPLRVLLGARLVEVKGHRYALMAIARLRAASIDVTLDCAGHGPLRDRLEREALDLGLTDRVRFLGVLDHGDLLSRLRDDEWDVVLLPSIRNGRQREGIPVMLIEAMAAGLPVVATSTGGIPELLESGAGIEVPERDPAAIADALARLAADPELRRRLSRASVRRAREQQLGYLVHEPSLTVNRRRWRWLSCWFDDKFLIVASYRLSRFLDLLLGRGWRVSRVLLAPGFFLFRPWAPRHGIHYQATIGRGLKILHPEMGVQVSKMAVIGCGLVLVGGNAVGRRRHGASDRPILGDDVELGMGAIVLGPVRIGDGVRVGAGAVVIHDVPDGATVVGVPARIGSPSPAPRVDAGHDPRNPTESLLEARGRAETAPRDFARFRDDSDRGDPPCTPR